MCFVAAVGVIFVLISFATSKVPLRSCSQIAENIERLTPQFNEPVGTWWVYKTTYDQFACRTMSYESSKLNETRVSWAKMTLRNSSDVIEFLITLVPAKSNQYVTIRKHDGEVALFYLLTPYIPMNNRHYFCGFSCEQDGIFAQSFQCLIRNQKVIPTVDKIMQEAHIPMRPNTYMYNLFEDCTISNRSSVQ